MTGSLVKGGLFGAIGGAAGGTAIAIMGHEGYWIAIGAYTVEDMVKAFGHLEWTPEILLIMMITIIAFDAFWGLIFGLVYSVTFDVIPGKGILKGLVFGMVAYLLSNLRWAQILSAFDLIAIVKIFLIAPGFIYFTILGLIIGLLYKK